MKKNLRVLHAPVNIGNQPWVLSRHERALGVCSDLVVNYSTWLQYPADRCLGQWLDSSWATRAGGCVLPWRRPGVATSFTITSANRFSVGETAGAQPAVVRRSSDWPNAPGGGPDDLAGLRRPAQRPLRRAKRNHHVPSRPVRMSAAACRDRRRPVRSECSSTASCPGMERVFVLNPELAHDVPRAEFLPYACVEREAIACRRAADRRARSRSFMPPATRQEGHPLRSPGRRAVATAASTSATSRSPAAPRRGDEALSPGRPGDRPTPGRLVRRLRGRMMAMGKPVACYIRDEDLRFVPPAMAASCR